MSPDQLAVLSALSQVPGMTFEQIVRLLGSDGRSQRALHSLLHMNMIMEREFQLRRSPPSEEPLYRGVNQPVTPETLRNLASQIRSRYQEPTITTVYSVGDFRRPLQVDHEIGVADVFLLYHERHADWQWLGEAPRRRALVPDATVVSPEGMEVVIDFVGQYREPKLRAITNYYASHGIPCELW